MMQVQETDLLLFLNQFSFDRLFALFLQSQCSSSTGTLNTLNHHTLIHDAINFKYMYPLQEP